MPPRKLTERFQKEIQRRQNEVNRGIAARDASARRAAPQIDRSGLSGVGGGSIGRTTINTAGGLITNKPGKKILGGGNRLIGR